MKKTLILAYGLFMMANTVLADNLVQDIKSAVSQDYKAYLSDLFLHFHQNPELSLVETKTAARIAKELRQVGFEVYEGVGAEVEGHESTALVAMMKNGPGPLVMMRADMDGLPVAEKSGLSYASTKTQISPITGMEVAVMHACGHDVHITSLVGTARRMAAMKNQWSGTLMLIGQPAEERILGARAMMANNIWQRFGVPDYALALHVSAGVEAGLVNVIAGSPYAGADTVDIVVHGVGAHGASPHKGKDPIVIASQIVVALQTLVSRELSPRQPGVVTVGSFHSGTKHNIISDKAILQLTVRNTNLDTRKILLDGIKRIAENMGRVAGMPEDKLPTVTISNETTPPTVNDIELVNRLKQVWQNKMGKDRVVSDMPTGMGAEDFSYFTKDPKIKSVYWTVGGTSKQDFAAEKKGGPAVPSHHSPLFKIAAAPAVKSSVESTVYALLELMKK